MIRIYATIVNTCEECWESHNPEFISLDPSMLKGNIYYIDMEGIVDISGWTLECRTETAWKPYTCIEKVYTEENLYYYNGKLYTYDELEDQDWEYDAVETFKYVEYKDGKLIREFYKNEYDEEINGL